MKQELFWQDHSTCQIKFHKLKNTTSFSISGQSFKVWKQASAAIGQRHDHNAGNTMARAFQRTQTVFGCMGPVSTWRKVACHSASPLGSTGHWHRNYNWHVSQIVFFQHFWYFVFYSNNLDNIQIYSKCIKRFQKATALLHCFDVDFLLAKAPAKPQLPA